MHPFYQNMTARDANRLLERAGSEVRVQAGDLVGEAWMAIIGALADRIEDLERKDKQPLA